MEVSASRRTALQALVLFGAIAAILTEILGALHAIRRGPMAAAWALVALTGLAAIRRKPATPAKSQPLGAANVVLLAVIIAMAGILAFIALLSPPNSSDAMTYHLPRVVHWAQAQSVAFFPTHYYPEISQPPMAEYLILQTYVLSGGDHYANLVQWLGWLGSVLAVSLIAKQLGSGARGQVAAAVFCATIPNGILQATGVKNDALLALWLAAMIYFALAWTERRDTASALWMGIALGLALFTKGTAYVLAPALLACVLFPAVVPSRDRKGAVAAPIVLAAVLAINGPQWWRNWTFSGSPIGFASAHSDGRFRWTNDHFGPRVTLSNALREIIEHVAARSDRWNRGVYDTVVRVHRWMGMDPNDPATTWLWSTFQPPVNANHEANSPNRWQLLLLVMAGAALLWRRRLTDERVLRWFALGLPLAFLLFCTVFRWQPYLARMHLPLFVLGSAVVGVLADRILPRTAVLLLCLFLLNNARPYLFENWVRPLRGPRGVLRTSRDLNYFADMKTYTEPDYYLESVRRTLAGGCTNVGIDSSLFQLEYPYEALLLQANPAIRFRHVGVANASARYATPDGWTPCAVLCLNCADNQEKMQKYLAIGPSVRIGTFLLFLRGAP